MVSTRVYTHFQPWQLGRLVEEWEFISHKVHKIGQHSDNSDNVISCDCSIMTVFIHSWWDQSFGYNSEILQG
jgi:hypothetical protein